MQLTSNTRTELKAFLSAQPYWTAYCGHLDIRDNGMPANTGNMLKAEWLVAAEAFGLDMTLLGNGVVYAGHPCRVQSNGTVDGAGSANTVVAPSVAAPVAPSVAPSTPPAVDIDSSDTLAAIALTKALDAAKAEDSEGGAPASISAIDMDAILEPIAATLPMLMPAVRSELVYNIETAVNAVAPVAPSAPVGARTVDVPVYVGADGALMGHAPMQASGVAFNSYVQTDTLGKVFGSRVQALANLACDVWSGDDSPEINPDYEFDTDILSVVFAAIVSKKPAWLAGYAGTGKTDFAEQIAARCGRGFTRICFHAESEVAPFIGQFVPDGKGGYKYIKGALALAIQKPGEIVLLDEVSSATNAVQTFLQTTQDKGTLTIPETGEVINVAPGVVFLVADNTLGFGDDTGAHHGKAMQDRASLDRYAQFVWFDYPKPAKEAKIIARKTGLAFDACERLVEYANMARAVVRSGEGSVAYPVTIRRLFAWADALVYGLDSETVFKTAILNCSGSDYEGLREIEKAHLTGAGHAAITCLARGEVIPADPVTETEAGDAASSDFDTVDSDEISF